MQKYNLIKIEVYRFFHSMPIVKYVIIIPLILFFMSYINIYDMGDKISGSLVWASIGSSFLYIIIFICVFIAVYLGREFKQKTINYEIMKGYGYCEIALSKIVTCGMIVTTIITMCMLLYLYCFQDIRCEDFIIRILGVFILFFHICTVAIFYVLLCRSAIGGCVISMIRIFVIEDMLQAMLYNLSFIHERRIIMKQMICNQWLELIHADIMITPEIICNIVIATLFENVFMQLVLLWVSKKCDFK